MALKDLIISEGVPDKITDIIVSMVSSNFMPFYAEFCFNINFIKANIKTCGVTVTSNGMYFLWSEEFVKKLTDPEMTFVMIHEIFHILFDHPKRSVGYDHKISNLAQDMIINSTIWHDIIMSKFSKETLRDKGFIDTPRRHDELVPCPYCIDNFSKKKNEDACKMCNGTGEIATNIGFFVPKEYTGEWIFEDLYYWLVEQHNKWREKNEVFVDLEDDNDCDDGNCGGGSSPSNGGNGKGGKKPIKGEKKKKKLTVKVKDQDGNITDIFRDCTDDYGLHGKSNGSKHDQHSIDTYPLDDIFKHIELNKGLSIDEHLLDEIPEEVRKQIVGTVLNRMRNAGTITGDIENILGKLQKKKEDHLKYIKRNITLNLLGNKKNRVITRPNRRDIFGLKGKRKYSSEINCVLDVSGSMSGTFEEVLSYIFQKDIAINLIQCDTEVKDHIKIKKMSELPKMKIKGLGGTILQPGLDYISADKKLNELNTVILTDGYLYGDLNFSKVKGYNLIISTGGKVKYSGTDKIKEIFVNEKQK